MPTLADIPVKRTACVDRVGAPTIRTSDRANRPLATNRGFEGHPPLLGAAARATRSPTAAGTIGDEEAETG
jgi:hypothetical protein